MFVERLNKKQEGFYVIEEEKAIQDGEWEGYLEHDNVNRESIVIYTGPNFTGTKVDNFFISIPSEMPWKTYLKVFSNSEKIYITYESQGDQVEAEDINQVQNALADTIKDLNDYKAITDASINDLDIRTTNLEETKASKTYVDTELNKVYKKEEVFNKEEVIQRIQDIIGAAPEALDTLEEIALALNEDPDFAATVTNLLAQKVDKVPGKGLSSEDFTTAEKQKLAGIEEGANKYIHPSTHPASMITETSSKRFVSDAEKANWNAKETPAGAQAKAEAAAGAVQAELDAHLAAIATQEQLGHVKVGQNLAIDSDGTLHAQASGGKKVARFVIGTSTSGWTEKDCDYLCDGTNDQEEIIQALNDLPATGGEVVILDGTYNITASINIPKDNVSIKGNGNATILKRMWNSSSAEGVITLTSVEGCKVQNLQIDGNKDNYTSINNNGIYLYSSSNNTVAGNTCNNNGEGIYLNSSSNNTVIGNICIRGTGQTSDYTSSQYTILLAGSSNNYNLISSNNCMGKAVVVNGGTGNSAWGNKYDSGDDLPI